MLIDKNLMFHDDTVVTTGAPTEYKGDSIPLHTADEMLREGRGEPLEVLIQLPTAWAGGTSAIFSLITAPETTLATDEIHMSTPAILLAELTLGKKIRFPLQMVSADTASYFGVMCAATGTFTTNSTFSAWIQRVGEDQSRWT